MKSKSLLILLIACLSACFHSFGQSTVPRIGSGVRYYIGNLNYVYASKTDGTGADSVVLSPNAYLYTYSITLVDSFTLKQPVVTNCHLGDQILIICSAASGTPFLKFTGSNWITAGKATLSTGLRAVITLVFDGAKWVEKSRVVQ